MSDLAVSLHVVDDDAGTLSQPPDDFAGVHCQQIAAIEDCGGSSQQQVSNLVPVRDLAQELSVDLIVERVAGGRRAFRD